MGWIFCVAAIFHSTSALAQDRERPRTSAADSAFAAGDVARADSLFYLAVRQRPRDPVAREALGDYLGMRGASRIAAVLLEEARMFGGDPARIRNRLVPLYESLGDWRALLSLTGAQLSVAERKRVAWLSEHPSSQRADSTSVALVGAVRGDTLGRIPVRIAGRAMMAVLVARDVGVILGPAAAISAHRFGDSVTVVLDSINIGRSRLDAVPATIRSGVDGVVIGVTTLSPMTIVLDYSIKRVVFNPWKRAASIAPLPLFRDHADLKVAETSTMRWRTLGAFVAAAGTTRPVTVDLKANEIRVPR